jgi:3-oxoacyl-[acyl-carrier protein] reductase
MSTLQGKTAIVTGASKNIGRAIAIRLAQAGCHLSLAARANEDGLRETVEAVRMHNVEAHPVLSDLSTTRGCLELIKTARDALGHIDILVHTVAVRPHQPFETIDHSDWEKVRRLILDSAMHLALDVVPEMAKQGYGRIILFTGLGAHIGVPERAHVSAAKMGIIGLARGLASEFASRNVRVNVISPGSIDTLRANPQWYANSPISTETIPMGRLGTVKEIADTAHFLVSDESGFITGQTLHVNGGEAFYE